jgi:hypothetical protein
MAYRYLTRFGYLDQGVVLAEELGAKDDAMRASLARLQTAFGLRSSGVLDDETRRLMSTPRCGFPDYVNGRAIIGPSYVLTGFVWRIREIIYGPIDPPVAYAHNWARYQQEVHIAMYKWNEQCGLDLKYQSDARYPHIGLTWDKYDGPWSFLANTNTYDSNDPNAVGGQQRARVLFDCEESWTTTLENPMVDVLTIALHEIGHALGLGHSTDPASVMFAYYPPGTIKRDLRQDERDAVVLLYGPNP